MQQTLNGGNKNVKEPPKEMSMEIRLLLAFLLMGAVMFLTPYFFKSSTPPPGQKTTKEAATATQQKAAPSPAPTPAAQAQTAETQAQTAEAPSTPSTLQQTQPPFIIDNGVYKIAFSNQGATVRSWTLDKYKGNDNKPLE